MNKLMIANRVIRPEISSYKQEMEAILSWMPDWLHQDEFDRKARHYEDTALLSPYGLTGETLVLQSNNPSVHLLQLMIADGWIEQKGKNGNIHYRAVSNG